MESSFVQFLTVLAIFVFVLAITVFTTRLVGGFQKKTMTGSNIAVLETCRIAPNKLIEIVKIGNRYFALALSKDSVETITELSEDEITIPDQTGMMPMSFKELFDKARERMQKK